MTKLAHRRGIGGESVDRDADAEPTQGLDVRSAGRAGAAGELQHEAVRVYVVVV
ncbi:MAG TPA: hypothetical protein VJT31_12885 [Rugosimonospora sp.]|nr:hypothetical protein [Rugosimonospora sp.]